MDAVPLTPPDVQDATMSFGDHLEELRRRLMLALIAPIPLAIAAFFVSAQLIELLLEPLFRVYAYHDLPLQVHEFAPAEFLMARLKLSIILAVVVSAPWILWQAWLFIRPGLFAHEKRFVYFLLPGSAILTLAGTALLYFGMLPLILHVLIMFGGSLRQPPPTVPTGGDAGLVEATEQSERTLSFDVVETDPENPSPGQAWIKMPERVLRIAVEATSPNAVEIFELSFAPPARLVQQYRVSEYINFVLMLLLGMVLAFQMPLVILLMGWLGLASVDWLRRQRRYAFLICAIVAAVITPADAISMIAMLVPLYGLYELGILLLVIAPAGAVAEGRFRWRSSAGEGEREDFHPPSQSTGAVPRRGEAREDGDPSAEDAGDDRDAQ